MTVTDTAGNPADVSITFPAVAKGDQTLTGFAFSPDTVTFGDTAPTLTAPSVAVGALSYTATPSTVCSVNATTGALTIAGVGDCDVTATAAGTDNYNEATATYTVTVNAIGTLSLNLNAIATDNTVNIAEKTAGFSISGDTGTEAGVTVSVAIGSTTLPATSADVSGTATWSVAVPPNASYIAGTSVDVTVSASKIGFTAPSDVERTLTIDLTAPTAPSYTAPGSLKVGVAMTAIGPSGGSGIDEYSAAGLPSGLTIDTGTGTISGTPDTAETNAANVTVTVSDSAGNTATVDITFPAVAKGDQTLTGFAYGSNSVTFGSAAPTLMAPRGAVGTLGYTATPTTVCTVNATTGALTIAGVGDCMVTATAAGTANYNQATATYTVTVNAAGTLSLNLNAIATDNTVNLVEKVVGFSISGDTGTEAGVTVSVAVGSTTLTATSDSSGAWSVAVPPGAAYIVGTSVDVTVSASKIGLIDASDVTRTLTIDLTAPTAPSYTAPGSLKVGEAIAAMSPTGGSGIDEYNAFGLPSGLAINASTGAISGTPDTADANTAEATVTFSDSAGNRVAVTFTFPAVVKGDQTLTGFAYGADSVTFGSTAPTLMAPSGAVGTLGYTATPTTVCTVNATTGALTIAGVGDCMVTATAAGTANYNQATATYTVTVQNAGVAVSFAAASLSVGEGDRATVTVTLAEAPASPVTVPIAATPGAGFGTSEYSGVPSSVTFNAGETSKSFTVTAAQDTDDEPDRVLTLGIGTLPAGYVPGTHAEFVLTVVDDDAPVVSATFARAAASVPEGASTTVTVRLSQAPEREVVLPIAATPGANLAADEFSGVPSSVTFAADATEAEFTVAFGDDAAVEGNETLTLAFGARPERVTPGANPQLVLTVTDDDGRPAPPAAPSVTATPGATTSLDAAWTAPENAGKPDIESYDLRYRVDGGANTWSNGPEDVTETSWSIAGLTAGTAYEVQVRATNDEGDSPWSESGSGSTSVYSASVATIRSERARQIEGGWINLTIRLTPPIDGVDTEVRVVAEDPDGALAPPHPSIDPQAPFLLSFPAGVDEIGYPVRLADNAEPNPARTVVFRLLTNEDFPHYGLGSPAAATVTVLDNDAVPAAPGGLEVALAPHRPAQDRVVLTWDQPEEIADYWLEHTVETYQARDRYQVRYRVSGAAAPAWSEDDWAALKVRSSLNSPGVPAGRIEAEVGGLDRGTAYDFEVRGANRAGFGAAAGVTFAPPPLTVAGSKETAPTNDAVPLTASFGSVPSQHNGMTPFTFRLSFSAEPQVDSAVLREAFTFTGLSGAVTKVTRAAAPSSRGWEITVTPTQFGDIAIELPATSDCAAAGAVCTADGRALSNSSSATVRLMPALSVADTEVTEAPGAKANFVVTLDRASSAPVTVGYGTVDGTAVARYDYEPASGTLRFAPGETRKTVSVTVLDDTHDDDGETFELRLFYYPTGAWLKDAEATATIRNADPLPEAWLARFGRTSSVHVVEAIGGRLRSAQRATPETHFTLGGRTVGGLFGAWDGIGAAFAPTGADTANPALEDESTWARMDRLRAESLAGSNLAGGNSAGGHLVGGGLAGPAGGNPQGSNLYGNSLSGGNPADSATSGGQAARSMLMSGLGLPTSDLRDVLMGSSFFYSRALGEDGRAEAPDWLGQWSAWGETAATRFSGADGPLSLDGEVATAILGADSRWGRWLAGVTLSHSLGEGQYTHTEALGGALTSTVTSVNPYAHYRLSDWTDVWGVLGYGVGALTLTPEGAEAGIETDLSNRMAAFGGRGVLTRRSGGFELALASDALMTSTASESVENLVGATGQTSRLRVMLEGSGSMPLSGGVLRPSLEAGLRYDDGDAETGAGIELGGGLGYAAGRLAVEVNARVLLTHEDTEYEEWGLRGSIAYRPNGDGRGLSANLGSTWGDTRSGVQRLWALDNARGLAPRAAMNAAQRFQAELGYGLRGRHVFAGRRGQALWYPYVGAEGAQGEAAALRLGLKLRAGPSAEAALELGRRDSTPHRGTGGGIEAPEHAIQLNGSIRW